MKANVSKLLRSALSMALALCLVIGMCPAAFAAEVDTSAVAGELKTAINKLVSVLEAGPDGVNAAIDFAKENRDEIKTAAVELREALAKAADKAENFANEELDAVMALAEDLLDELQAQSDALSAEVADKEAQLDEVQVKLDNYNADAAEYQAQLDQYNADLEAAGEDASEEVKAELDAKKAELDAKQVELNEKKADLDESQAKVDGYREQADAAKAAIAKVNDAIEAVRAALEPVEARIEKILAIRAGIREAILYLDNIVVDLLAKVENLVSATIDATDLTLEDVAKAVKTAKAEVAETLNNLEAGLITVEELVNNLVEETVAAHPEVAAAAKIALDTVKNVYNDADIDLPNKDAVIAKAEALAEKAVAAAKTLAEKAQAFWAENGAEIKATIKNIIAVWKQAYADATSDTLMINTDSTYVALGDATAVSASYVDELAVELVKEGLVPGNYVNLADSDAKTVADVIAQVSDPAVADASLITVGIGNVAFLSDAIAQASAGELNLDWAKFSGEYLNYEVIAPIFDEVYEGLHVYEGMDAEVAEFATNVLEAYAYNAVAYAYEVPALINAIRAVNDHAVVVMVGMYNPLTDAPLAVRIGLESVVVAASAHGKAYCMLTGNAIYVDAWDVDTVGSGELKDVLSVSKMIPSAAGSDYIQKCIYEALGLYNPMVMRLWGETRWQTATGIADTLKALNNTTKFENIIVTTGLNFADALVGTYLADVKDAPILLINENKYLGDIVNYVAANLAENGTIYILGQTDAVPASIEAQLAPYGNIVRLGGATRFETNLEILNAVGVEGKDLLVCTGLKYADSLSASPTGLPILLVAGDKLRADQEEFLKNANIENVIILGGEAAVSPAMADVLAAYDVDGNVERLGGATRYETSALIAERFFGKHNEKVVMARGLEFPDGLCGGSLATALGAPVILTESASVNGEWYKVADEYVKRAEMGVVLGGPEACVDNATVVEVFDLVSVNDITEVFVG